MTKKNKSPILVFALLLISSLANASTIENPGFESGMSGWIEVEPAFVSYVTYSGSQSLKISGSPGRVTQFVSINTNTNYVLSAWVRGEGQIIADTGDDGPGSLSTRFDSDDWTQVELAFNSGNAGVVEIGAQYTVSSDVRFDDFALESDTNDNGNDDNNSDDDLGDNSYIEFIQSIFDVEGDYPYRSNNTMVFDALSSQYVSSNGNGWRNEVKIASEFREDMSDTNEEFSARVTPILSDGSKTIFVQHHASGTGTLMKAYISDSSESGFFDSEPNNGVFDVYVRLTDDDGDEEKFPLGTITSGESFDVRVINYYGYVTVSAFGVSASMQVKDSSSSYFKFGNYLQAQDAESGEKVDDSDDFGDFYDDAGITESEITFSEIFYQRDM